MSYYKQLRIFLWSIDPGYFRLKHAAKTILAIVITLCLLESESLFIKVMSCVVCGFSMQGIVAKSYLFRFVHVFLFDLIFCGVFILGIFLRDTNITKSLVLIFLGFILNYIRRFGLQHSTAPLMIWIVCFLAMILPLESAQEVWLHLHAPVIGLVVSALVILSVFPDNYPRLFVSNSNGLFRVIARGLRDIRRYLIMRAASQNFEKEGFVKLKQNINHLLESNQAMEQSQVFIKEQNKLSEIIIHQYSLAHAYFLMVEAYRILKIHDYHLSPSLRLRLSTINRQFEVLFDALKMREDYSVYSKTLGVSLNRLASLTEKLGDELLTKPTVIMALLNLKLSFNLLNEHVTSLLRGDDEM